MNKCDVCNIESDNVVAGRWIFYCPAHKAIDRQRTLENEMPNFDDSDLNYAMQDGELQEILLETI